MHLWQAPLTHHGQSCAFGELPLQSLQHFQARAIQIAPVDSAIGRTYPVQLVGSVVYGEACEEDKRRRDLRLERAQACDFRELTVNVSQTPWDDSNNQKQMDINILLQ